MCCPNGARPIPKTRLAQATAQPCLMVLQHRRRRKSSALCVLVSPVCACVFKEDLGVLVLPLDAVCCVRVCCHFLVVVFLSLQVRLCLSGFCESIHKRL
jgi:hypothetical protein